MSRRPSPALVLALLLVGLCAFAQRQAHVMGVQHEWCASHAAWTHADACEDEVVAHCHSELVPQKQDEAPEDEEHEHCSILVLDELEAQAPRLAPGVLVDLGLAPPGFEIVLHRAPSDSGVPLLALAPKNSPPV